MFVRKHDLYDESFKLTYQRLKRSADLTSSTN